MKLKKTLKRICCMVVITSLLLSLFVVTDFVFDGGHDTTAYAAEFVGTMVEEGLSVPWNFANISGKPLGTETDFEEYDLAGNKWYLYKIEEAKGLLTFIDTDGKDRDGNFYEIAPNEISNLYNWNIQSLLNRVNSVADEYEGLKSLIQPRFITGSDRDGEDYDKARGYIENADMFLFSMNNYHDNFKHNAYVTHPTEKGNDDVGCRVVDNLYATYGRGPYIGTIYTSDSWAKVCIKTGSHGSWAGFDTPSYDSSTKYPFAPMFSMNASDVVLTRPGTSDKTVSSYKIKPYTPFDLMTASKSLRIREDKAPDFTTSVDDMELSNVEPGQIYRLSYSGAGMGTLTQTPGDSINYISTIIYDMDGKVLHYGPVSELKETEGTVNIRIPNTLTEGTDYYLAVFEEERCPAGEDDYASVMSVSKFTAQAKNIIPEAVFSTEDAEENITLPVNWCNFYGTEEEETDDFKKYNINGQEWYISAKNGTERTFIDTDCKGKDGNYYSTTFGEYNGSTGIADGQYVMDYTNGIADDFPYLKNIILPRENLKIEKYGTAEVSGLLDAAYMWFPSVNDMVSGTYISNKVMKKVWDTVKGDDSTPYIWLRNAYLDYGTYYVYNRDDIGYNTAQRNISLSGYVAPAFNLDLDDVFITRDRNEANTVIPLHEFTPYEMTAENTKYVVNDRDSKAAFTTDLHNKILTNAVSDGKYEFTYSGASTGTMESSGKNYLSAAIYDENGVIVYYGNLSEITSTSGKGSITIPSGLTLWEHYYLAIFEEEKSFRDANDHISTMSVSEFQLRPLVAEGTDIKADDYHMTVNGKKATFVTETGNLEGMADEEIRGMERTQTVTAADHGNGTCLVSAVYIPGTVEDGDCEREDYVFYIDYLGEAKVTTELKKVTIGQVISSSAFTCTSLSLNGDVNPVDDSNVYILPKNRFAPDMERTDIESLSLYNGGKNFEVKVTDMTENTLEICVICYYEPKPGSGEYKKCVKTVVLDVDTSVFTDRIAELEEETDGLKNRLNDLSSQVGELSSSLEEKEEKLNETCRLLSEYSGAYNELIKELQNYVSGSSINTDGYTGTITVDGENGEKTEVPVVWVDGSPYEYNPEPAGQKTVTNEEGIITGVYDIYETKAGDISSNAGTFRFYVTEEGVEVTEVSGEAGVAEGLHKDDYDDQIAKLLVQMNIIKENLADSFVQIRAAQTELSGLKELIDGTDIDGFTGISDEEFEKLSLEDQVRYITDYVTELQETVILLQSGSSDAQQDCIRYQKAFNDIYRELFGTTIADFSNFHTEAEKLKTELGKLQEEKESLDETVESLNEQLEQKEQEHIAQMSRMETDITEILNKIAAGEYRDIDTAGFSNQLQDAIASMGGIRADFDYVKSDLEAITSAGGTIDPLISQMKIALDLDDEATFTQMLETIKEYKKIIDTLQEEKTAAYDRGYQEGIRKGGTGSSSGGGNHSYDYGDSSAADKEKIRELNLKIAEYEKKMQAIRTNVKSVKGKNAKLKQENKRLYKKVKKLKKNKKKAEKMIKELKKELK